MNKVEIQKKLFENQDLVYRDFQAKLTPTVNVENVIGVRTPILRNIAKEIYKSGEYKDFLEDLPHKYYDEYNLHGFIISEEKDFDKTVEYLEKFLPYVDNWATCDLLSPKSFKKNHDRMIVLIEEYISSNKPFTIRFGIEMLMTHFLDEEFKSEYSEKVSKIKNEEYYVKMMVAWYFATALAKQYNDTVYFLERKILDKWTHNKTIQKAVESYRITSEQKEYLKSLKY